MFSRHIIEHHSETLDLTKEVLHSGLETLHDSLTLCLKMSQEQSLYPYAWSIAMTEGQAPRRMSDLVSENLRSSTHLITDQYAEFVRLFEAQFHVFFKRAHRTLDQLHYWSPRSVEQALGQIDVVLSSAETSADQLADASVKITRSLEEQIGRADSDTPSTKRRRVA